MTAKLLLHEFFPCEGEDRHPDESGRGRQECLRYESQKVK